MVRSDRQVKVSSMLQLRNEESAATGKERFDRLVEPYLCGIFVRGGGGTELSAVKCWNARILCAVFAFSGSRRRQRGLSRGRRFKY